MPARSASEGTIAASFPRARREDQSRDREGVGQHSRRRAFSASTDRLLTRAALTIDPRRPLRDRLTAFGADAAHIPRQAVATLLAVVRGDAPAVTPEQEGCGGGSDDERNPEWHIDACVREYSHLGRTVRWQKVLNDYTGRHVALVQAPVTLADRRTDAASNAAPVGRDLPTITGIGNKPSQT